MDSPGLTPECIAEIGRGNKHYSSRHSGSKKIMADKDFRHIVRVANTDLVGEKKVVDALRKVKGVSFMTANAICMKAGVKRTLRMGDLAESDVKKLQAVLEDMHGAGIPIWLLNRRQDQETGDNSHLLTNDLLFVKDNDIKRLRKIKSYRGVRHALGLPVRGQRTRSNFRKNKGKKR